MHLRVDSRIYPLEAILSACYAFLDRAYCFLDKDLKNSSFICVSLKTKKSSSKNEDKRLCQEFLNELLYCAVRQQVSRNNKKIREYVMGRALYSPAMDFFASEAPQSDKETDYLEDPLGIAIPWEDKYGKKKSSGNKKKSNK